MIKILMNWCPDGLCKNLRQCGVFVDKIASNNLKDLVSSYGAYDSMYFARFSPPLLDKELIRGHGRIPPNLVYAFHAPIQVDYPVRPVHFLYNVLMPFQAKLSSSRGFRLHLLNEDDYKLLHKLSIENKRYVPLGVDIDEMKTSEEKSSSFTAFYASRASWHKGTDLLVSRIIPLLLRKIPDIKIVIIRYGFLKKLYDLLGDDRRLILMDYLPREDFLKTLSQSHVLLFPSRYESFGRLIVESLASGVIPVTFDTRGAARDILSKSNLLRNFVVSGTNYLDLVKKVINIYKIWRSNDEQYSRLVSAARIIGEKYSWSNIAPLFAKMLAG